LIPKSLLPVEQCRATYFQNQLASW